MGLLGIYAFDLRRMRKAFYMPTHDYPILAMDAGLHILQNLAVTSGITTNY